MARFGSGWWLDGRFSPALTAPGVGGGAAPDPFDGVFFDTDAGDTFTSRLSYTPNAALTVEADSVAFSSASEVSLDLNVKEDDDSIMWQCFDHFEMVADYTITSFPAGDVVGFHTGWKRDDDPSNFFTAATKAFPGYADYLLRRLDLNGSPLGTGGSYQITAPVAATITVQREGAVFKATQNYNNGASSEQLSHTMGFPANSSELPRAFCIPMVRFKQGVHELLSLKVSASFPNAPFGFLGDSLTQGRIATAYADGFPQLCGTAH